MSKNWRKMLEGVGGYENGLVSVPAEGVREIIDEVEMLRTQLAEALAACAAKDKALLSLIGGVEGLAEESSGVYGLHLNGDESPWEELLPGGRFERLESLDTAKDALTIKPSAAALLRHEAKVMREGAEKCREIIAKAEDWDSSYWDQACEHCATAVGNLAQQKEREAEKCGS